MKKLSIFVVGVCLFFSLVGVSLEVSAYDEGDLKRLKTTRECVNCDLTNANLKYAQLKGANLAGADLTDANLSKANLKAADLTGSDLSWAILSGANLTDANLIGANLTELTLFGANLTNITIDEKAISTLTNKEEAKRIRKNAKLLTKQEMEEAKRMEAERLAEAKKKEAEKKAEVGKTYEELRAEVKKGEAERLAREVEARKKAYAEYLKTEKEADILKRQAEAELAARRETDKNAVLKLLKKLKENMQAAPKEDAPRLNAQLYEECMDKVNHNLDVYSEAIDDRSCRAHFQTSGKYLDKLNQTSGLSDYVRREQERKIVAPYYACLGDRISRLLGYRINYEDWEKDAMSFSTCDKNPLIILYQR